MTTRTQSRLLIALAAIVMLPVFVSPLWSITLVAPQYPEGLGMHIYVNDIQGHDRHDLQNINILNHYIGMQEIDPATVPELEIMPWVLGGLIATGLLVALIGSPWLMAGWLGLFLVAGVAGMVDFYLWNIDYGHNLSPDAPIRIPDMTYSPPIIGTEQILNIRASSYPHLGTLWLTISMVLAVGAVFLGFRARSRRKDGARAEGDAVPETARSAPRLQLLPLLLLPVLAACGPGERTGNAGLPPPATDRMVYGENQDPFCGGEVERVRWGGEARMADGGVLRFRSAECMAGWVLAREDAGDRPASLRVVDFPHGWRLIDVEEATFLQTPNLSSPDRLNLLAIRDEAMVTNLRDAYTGRLMDWNEVLRFVESQWDVSLREEGA